MFSNLLRFVCIFPDQFLYIPISHNSHHVNRTQLGTFRLSSHIQLEQYLSQGFKSMTNWDIGIRIRHHTCRQNKIVSTSSIEKVPTNFILDAPFLFFHLFCLYTFNLSFRQSVINCFVKSFGRSDASSSTC